MLHSLVTASMRVIALADAFPPSPPNPIHNTEKERKANTVKQRRWDLRVGPNMGSFKHSALQWFTPAGTI